MGEIKRILKPEGQAYLSLGAGPPFGLVDREEWEEILKEFNILDGGSFREKWVIVSKERNKICHSKKIKSW